MPISYKKLFHLLVDKNIKEGEFRRMADISAPTLAKLRSGKTITTEIISKICEALHCQPSDIMEYIEDSATTEKSSAQQKNYAISYAKILNSDAKNGQQDTYEYLKSISTDSKKEGV